MKSEQTTKPQPRPQSIPHPPSNSLVQWWQLQHDLDAGTIAAGPGNPVVHTGTVAMAAPITITATHTTAIHRDTGGDFALIVVVVVLVWIWGFRRLWQAVRLSRWYTVRQNERRYRDQQRLVQRTRWDNNRG